jgi:hypothetical protein
MSGLTPKDRGLLRALQQRALQYFLDNQSDDGLILDRQRNHGPPRRHGLCSTTATGMGCIALARASAPPYDLLSPFDAAQRVRAALEAALRDLPHDRGILPHFFDSCAHRTQGQDHLSTIDTAWLVAGALWAAAFLGDRRLRQLAADLYERIDWRYWSALDSPQSVPLLRHGQTCEGQFLTCTWDRLNGETVFMYVLAAGADGAHALPASSWQALRPYYGTTGGLHFNNADLGLFVFQYGLDLLDLSRWRLPGGLDLAAEAAVAAEGNYRACRDLADRFQTYHDYWGLSAGDGPANGPDGFAYQCYAPSGPIDGTAHVTASLASIAHRPALVLDNLHRAAAERRVTPLGRYGFSTINLDHCWVGPEMVGIDAGAAILALDNYLEGDRVRQTFHAIPCVQLSLERSGFAADRRAA